jgi:hypothetical protein
MVSSRVRVVVHAQLVREGEQQSIRGQHRLIAREFVGDLVRRPGVATAEPGVGSVEPELVAIVASTTAEVALVLKRDDRDHAPAYRDARLVLPARRGPCLAERRDLFGLQPIEADPGVF